jgi:Sec63 Brl domain
MSHCMHLVCVPGRSVLRVQLKITPEFTWHDRAHGGALRWHLWVEDSDSETIYHTEVPALCMQPMQHFDDDGTSCCHG